MGSGIQNYGFIVIADLFSIKYIANESHTHIVYPGHKASDLIFLVPFGLGQSKIINL
jgi:hypothetical protein